MAEVALVVVVGAFILSGDMARPTPAPADANASTVLELLQLGFDHAEHANIVGEGLQSLQDDPSVKASQKDIVGVITSNKKYREQSFSSKEIADPDGFTANGPTGNWVRAAGDLNPAFWMVHSGSISGTNIKVSADGTISVTWHIDDAFDFIPGPDHSKAYNAWASVVHLLYNDILGAEESYPTEAEWHETIPPPYLCNRCR